MVNRIRTLYPCGLNKGFGLKFYVSFQVRQETTEESWRMHQPKRCECDNKDEDNSLNTLNDKNFNICMIIQIVNFHFEDIWSYTKVIYNSTWEGFPEEPPAKKQGK